MNSGWVGTTISGMETAARTRIPFLMRFGTGIVPTQSTVFQDGDLLYAAVTNEQVAEVEDILGSQPVEH